MKIEQGEILKVKNGAVYAALENSSEDQERVKAKKIIEHKKEGDVEIVKVSDSSFSVPKTAIRLTSQPIAAISRELGLLPQEVEPESDEIVELPPEE